VTYRVVLSLPLGRELERGGGDKNTALSNAHTLSPTLSRTRGRGLELRTLREMFQTHPLPRLEQFALAAYALNKPRSWLLAHDTDTLTDEQSNAVANALRRRTAGEPVAYITEQREFYGLNFKVSPAVLIPRPETELLVDWLVQHAPQAARVLDLGTGSGAIAIAAAHARPDINIHAADISEAALNIAAYNNAALVQSRVQLHQSDWLISLVDQTFDIIVSNPPYIAANDTHLSQGDLRHEPATALTDFDDGFKHYRSIAAQAKRHLSAGGAMLLEHGWQQGEALCALLHEHGYTNIEQHYDAAAHGERGHPRMVSCRGAI
jgi:release factor glutamine methyltransferase